MKPRSPLCQSIALAIACLWLLLAAAPARAATPQQVAEAEAAFRQARTLMKQGKHREACPLLEKSQKLDPGMGTQFRLAECYEKTNRLASAWRHYRAVARMAQMTNRAKRQKFAQARAAALEPRLRKVVIALPAAVQKVVGLTVERDGKVVERSAWQLAAPVDAGLHRVKVTVPGNPPWSTEVRAGKEGSTVTVQVPSLEVLQVNKPNDGKGQRIAGLVTAGTGLVGIGAGIVVGLMARSSYQAADGDCPGNVCNQAGFDRRNRARTQGDVATVIFAVGAAAMTAGTVVWLTAPSVAATKKDARAKRAQLGLSPLGLRVRVTW